MHAAHLRRSGAQPCGLLSEGHAEAKLVVGARVIELAREDEADAGGEELLEEGGDLAVAVDASPQAALAEGVVVADRRARLPGRADVKQEVRRK